jgi:hypothetical protein
MLCGIHPSEKTPALEDTSMRRVEAVLATMYHQKTGLSGLVGSQWRRCCDHLIECHVHRERLMEDPSRLATEMGWRETMNDEEDRCDDLRCLDCLVWWKL